MSATQPDPAPIVPVEQRTIDFYGDELVAVRDEGGTVWVPVRRVCEVLGVDWSAQRRRILRDPILAEAIQSVAVTATNPSGAGDPQALALPLKYVRAWLFGINATRVRAELRDKLLAYQREVIEIIDRAFSRVPVAVEDADEAHMVAMRDLALQQAELARQQADLWGRLIAERRRLDAVQELAEGHEGMIRDLERSIEDVRAELGRVQAEVGRRLTALSQQIKLLPAPREATITPEQKATIQGLIEDLVAAADEKGMKLWQGKNNYQAAYRTMNRTFGVGRYDELTQVQYPKVVEWLQREIARVEGRLNDNGEQNT